MRISADSNVERGPNSFSEQRGLTPEWVEQNLRLNGCPESLIARTVKRYKAQAAGSRAVSVPVTPAADRSNSDVEKKVALLQKTARAVGRPLTFSEVKSLLAGERDCSNCAGGGDDMQRALRGHIESCAALLDTLVATSDTAQSIMDADGWDDGDKEEDSLRALDHRARTLRKHNRKKFRELHREFHRMLGEVYGAHARTRLGIDAILD